MVFFLPGRSYIVWTRAYYTWRNSIGRYYWTTFLLTFIESLIRYFGDGLRCTPSTTVLVSTSSPPTSIWSSFNVGHNQGTSTLFCQYTLLNLAPKVPVSSDRLLTFRAIQASADFIDDSSLSATWEGRYLDSASIPLWACSGVVCNVLTANCRMSHLWFLLPFASGISAYPRRVARACLLCR